MPDPSVQKSPAAVLLREVARLSPWKQLLHMINNISLSSEGKQLRLGEKMCVSLSPKIKKTLKDQRKGYFLLFCF